MQQRGRVQEGMVADLTLFDPVTVESRATYKVGENGLPPVGIPYVIVNGTVVVDGGEVLDVRPGQPIRFPVEEKGRFVPISPGGWLNENTISDQIVPHMDDSGAGQMVGGHKH
jgi:N-acyl-D-glutamate deacylase